MKSIVPCIWLDDQAEAAAAFYVKTFGDGRITAVSHYPETSDNPSKKPRGSVLTVELEIRGQRFTALNGGPIFKVNPSISFFVNVDTADEADRLFAALAEGGEPLMPIGTYPWSERYGWVKDRFGVTWQVMAARESSDARAEIVPCLMFTGPQHGRAEEALQFYTATFPYGRIDFVERYTEPQGPEGTVKHGRFSIDWQPMVVMDSHGPHKFTFDEGLSLQVMCEDQAEIDRYWKALSEGGQESNCGWLKDRFGVSWQIVPRAIVKFLTATDVAARDRAFAAVMTMKKLDIAAITRAFEGG